MPRDVSPEPNSPEYQRNALFNRLLFDHGWVRFLPDATVRVLTAVMMLGSPTADDLARMLPPAYHEDEPRGLDGAAWEPLVTWTDDSLRKLHEEHPPQPGEARTAAEANAEEQRDRDARIAEVDGYAAALGVPPPRTVADVMELLVACTVLGTRTDDAGQTRYELNPQAPLPDEVLPLSAEQRAAEDQLRWTTLHEPITQRIIALFNPDGALPRDVVKTSLQRLARELDIDADTARAAVTELVRNPDFSANRDPELVAEHAIIEISVDWDVFTANRMHIITAPRDNS